MKTAFKSSPFMGFYFFRQKLLFVAAAFAKSLFTNVRFRPFAAALQKLSSLCCIATQKIPAAAKLHALKRLKNLRIT